MTVASSSKSNPKFRKIVYSTEKADPFTINQQLGMAQMTEEIENLNLLSLKGKHTIKVSLNGKYETDVQPSMTV